MMTKLIKVGSLAGLIYDFYDDVDFLENPKVEKLMKLGTLLKPSALDALPDHCFVIKLAGSSRIKRAFPVYNKQAAQLSINYFNKYGSNLPMEAMLAVKEGLVKAASKFGITTKSKEQSSNLDAPVIIKKASLEFLKNKIKHSYEMKKIAASKIKAAADKSGVDIPSEVSSYAGSPEKEVFGPMVAIGLTKRSDALANGEDDPVIKFVWNSIQALAPKSRPTELVTILEVFDKFAGLDESYSKFIPDPIETVFSNEKLASLKSIDKQTAYTSHKVKGNLGVSNLYKRLKDNSSQETRNLNPNTDVKKTMLLTVARRMRPRMFPTTEHYIKFVTNPVAFYNNCNKKIKGIIDEQLNRVEDMLSSNDYE